MLVLTSVNGVEAFSERLKHLKISKIELRDLQVAVIGPATAAAFAAQFWEPDVIPEEFVSDALPDAIGDVEGRRFLLARSDAARKSLAEELKKRGAEVFDLALYSTIALDANSAPKSVEQLRELEAPSCLTFTSPLTVQGFVNLSKAAGKSSWLQEIPSLCIGPITANALQAQSAHLVATAREYTVDGLLKTIDEFFSAKEA